MVNLAERLAKKTGLSREECDGILKVAAFEILTGLREYGDVSFPGIGHFRKQHTETGSLVYLYLFESAVAKLNEPYTGERNDEIILK
jgi:hypothetical protein